MKALRRQDETTDLIPTSPMADGKPLALGDLLSYLAPKLARNPSTPVIIHPDPLASYGAMVDVYDELRQGKEKLGLRDEIQIALPTRREAMQLWL